MADDVSPDAKQQRMREFLQLLPLTLDLAGLPKAPADRLYSPDQMEARALSIRSAYKIARQLVREAGEG